jgi:lipopolysaccharide/colanic/teichoic acid biosynthesis glycosyltransferase
VRLVRPHEPECGSSKLTTNVIDILPNRHLRFERNPFRKLIMTNAQVRTPRYASKMRVARRHQFLRRTHEQGAPYQVKRLADMVIACVILALTLPLMIIVSLMVKSESPGPVFERQLCIGRGGRRFHALKFRTLRRDPEHRMPVWARRTQVGQFLRYTRIEGLPQLVNVLRGEMSLIDRDGRSPSFLS